LDVEIRDFKIFLFFRCLIEVLPKKPALETKVIANVSLKHLQ